MPCMGPSKEDAYKAGEGFKIEVMNLLEKKHAMSADRLMFDKSKEDWSKQEDIILKALQEMFWIESSDSF